MKETIESILVAFVLAFVFRASVVALPFVISHRLDGPDAHGSARPRRLPRLWLRLGHQLQCPRPPGQQRRRGGSADDDVEVPTKGIEWQPDRDLRDANGQTGYKPVNISFTTHCPNCGEAITLGSKQKAFPVQYGDRILVLKYAYLLGAPQRWDVVVFKTPADPRRYKYQVNYIKRLVGKPGECVMVLDGGVYVATCPDNVRWEDWEKTPDAEKT